LKTATQYGSSACGLSEGPEGSAASAAPPSERERGWDPASTTPLFADADFKITLLPEHGDADIEWVMLEQEVHLPER
jgi:hypothetical protein